MINIRKLKEYSIDIREYIKKTFDKAIKIKNKDQIKPFLSDIDFFYETAESMLKATLAPSKEYNIIIDLIDEINFYRYKLHEIYDSIK